MRCAAGRRAFDRRRRRIRWRAGSRCGQGTGPAFESRFRGCRLCALDDRPGQPEQENWSSGPRPRSTAGRNEGQPACLHDYRAAERLLKRRLLYFRSWPHRFLGRLVGQQIRQQVEHLLLAEHVDDPGRHVRLIRSLASDDVGLADGHALVARGRPQHQHLIVFALDPARQNRSGRRFDQHGRIFVGHDLRRQEDRFQDLGRGAGGGRFRSGRGRRFPPALRRGGIRGSPYRETPCGPTRSSARCPDSSSEGSRSSIRHSRTKTWSVLSLAIQSRNSLTAAWSTWFVTSGGIWPRPRCDRRWSSTERSGVPGATSIALVMPNVSCCGRAFKSSILSRGVESVSCIRELPPPASTWHTEQFTCR